MLSKKKITSIAIVGCLTVGGLSAFGYDSLKDNRVLNKLLSEAEQLVIDFSNQKETEIQTLNQNIETLTTEKNNLTVQLETATNNYNNTMAELETANQTINAKDEQISNLMEKLSQAEAAGQEKQTLIDSLNTQIEALEAGKLEAEQQRDEALNRLAELEQEAKGQGFETIEDYLNNLKNLLAEANATIEAKQQEIETLTANLENAEQEAAYYEGLVTEAENSGLEHYNVIAQTVGAEQITKDNIQMDGEAVDILTNWQTKVKNARFVDSNSDMNAKYYAGEFMNVNNQWAVGYDGEAITVYDIETAEILTTKAYKSEYIRITYSSMSKFEVENVAGSNLIYLRNYE